MTLLRPAFTSPSGLLDLPHLLDRFWSVLLAKTMTVRVFRLSDLFQIADDVICAIFIFVMDHVPARHRIFRMSRVPDVVISPDVPVALSGGRVIRSLFRGHPDEHTPIMIYPWVMSRILRFELSLSGFPLFRQTSGDLVGAGSGTALRRVIHSVNASEDFSTDLTFFGGLHVSKDIVGGGESD